MNFLKYNNNWKNDIEKSLYKLELIKNNIPILFCNINFAKKGPIIDLYRRMKCLSGELRSAIPKLVGAIVCSHIDLGVVDKYTAISHWLVDIVEWRNKLLLNTNYNDNHTSMIKIEIYDFIFKGITQDDYRYPKVKDFLKTFFDDEIRKHRNNPKYTNFINKISKVKLSQQESNLVLTDTLKVLKSIVLDTNANLIKTLSEMFGDWITNNKYTKNINLANVINKLKILKK